MSDTEDNDADVAAAARRALQQLMNERDGIVTAQRDLAQQEAVLAARMTQVNDMIDLLKYRPRQRGQRQRITPGQLAVVDKPESAMDVTTPPEAETLPWSQPDPPEAA